MTNSPPSIPEFTVTSLNEYLERVQSLPGEGTLLFRGQRHDWPLKPKVGRINPRRGSILEMEQAMLSEFKRKSVPMLAMKPESDLEWLAIAQHNGLATRLLDWTEHSLAALWFAVRNPPEHDGDGWAQGVVWCLRVIPERLLPQNPPNRIETDVFSAKKSMVYRPRHIFNRIVAQAGWFTVHHYETKNNRFGDFGWHPVFQEHMSRIVIPGNRFSNLRRTLESMGTNDATLFPDLVGLCDQIEREHRRDADENLPKRLPLRKKRGAK